MRTRNFLMAIGLLFGTVFCGQEAYATPHHKPAAPTSSSASSATGIGIGVGGGAQVTNNNNPVIAPVTNISNQNYMAPFIAPAAINEGSSNSNNNINNLTIQGSAPNWMSTSGNLEPGRTELNFGLQVYGQDQGATTFAGTLQLRHVFATPADRQMSGSNQRRVELGNQLLEAQIETERARAELMRQQADLVGAQASGQVLDNMDRLVP